MNNVTWYLDDVKFDTFEHLMNYCMSTNFMQKVNKLLSEAKPEGINSTCVYSNILKIGCNTNNGEAFAEYSFILKNGSYQSNWSLQYVPVGRIGGEPADSTDEQNEALAILKEHIDTIDNQVSLFLDVKKVLIAINDLNKHREKIMVKKTDDLPPF